VRRAWYCRRSERIVVVVVVVVGMTTRRKWHSWMTMSYHRRYGMDDDIRC